MRRAEYRRLSSDNKKKWARMNHICSTRDEGLPMSTSCIPASSGSTFQVGGDGE